MLIRVVFEFYLLLEENILRFLDILIKIQYCKSAVHIIRCVCICITERFDYPYFIHRHLENKHGILVYIRVYTHIAA